MIGREKETRILKENYRSDESSFVAIYGRRRVGKTYLVGMTFEDKIFFHHAGIYEGSTQEQIASFMSDLEDCGYKGEEKITDWFDAFNCLKKLISTAKEKKKVIFLDEIAWMYTKKSNFIKALENFWNGWASIRRDVMLIICSSATSWIINNIIHSKGGLYNRVTTQIYLEPFSLGECEQYCASNKLSLSKKQTIETYMVIGGVPYYWRYLKKGQSIPKFIDECFFANDAPLKNELKYIFSSLFSNPDGYTKIIEALSKKSYGLTKREILESTKEIDNGNFTNKLEDLISCGFIREYSPLHYKKTTVVYQLIDPFTIFHFHFLTKKSNDGSFWTNQFGESSINAWKGLAFERVCLLHADKIKKALGIAGVHTAVYPWSSRKDAERNIHGSQIDMVIERKDGIINLFEIKYCDAAYCLDSKDVESLYQKKNDFVEATKTKSAIHLSMIALNGVKENAYSLELQSIVSADDLFN
jgi:uncharacterized protein